MALWTVRAGRNGEHEDTNLAEGVASLGWDPGDLAGTAVGLKEDLVARIRELHPDKSAAQVRNWAGQVWRFRYEMKQGDVVALPLKSRPAVALGVVTGDYCYRPGLPAERRSVRPVRWERDDVPRTGLAKDLFFSLGALQTVCRITRKQAEERLRAVMSGQPDPLFTPDSVPTVVGEGGEDEAALPADLEQMARDQIQSYLIAHFKGHGLARLVDAILQAQGYHTHRSLPGPDAGIDILAGRGAMGLDPPKLAVQVKSGAGPVEVGVLRELQGVMKNFGAEQGLLVSWGGITTPLRNDARKLLFEVRLWDADDLFEALAEHYDRLPDELQAELPLKRVWTLVAPPVE